MSTFSANKYKAVVIETVGKYAVLPSHLVVVPFHSVLMFSLRP